MHKLPSDILAKRDALPDKPAPVILEGKYVCLRPLVISQDAQRLFELSNGSPIRMGARSMDAYDADNWIWRYLFQGPFDSIEEFSTSLGPQVEAQNGLCLCVLDKASGSPVGVANFMNNIPSHLKIELGVIWYSPIAQKTSANTEASLLMLKHVFNLGYRRVEWKCDARNDRSRKAAFRIGFQFEGVQESHMIIKGCNRDTAWFRMLGSEWPEIEEKLSRLFK